MRLVLASVVVCMLAARGDTCPEVDETFVQGSGAQIGRGESKIATVAPRPSFFVHIGRDSGPNMPVFTTLDGTVLRVALEIEAGMILVRFPDERGPSTYVVDPHFNRVTPWRAAEFAISAQQLATRVSGRYARIAPRLPRPHQLW